MMDLGKDAIYDFLTAPDRGSFAELMQNTNSESDNLDFKERWIEKGKLAKIVLSMANSGGGIIIFGVKENNDGDIDPCGIESFKDQSDVYKSLKKYIPSTLSFKTNNYDFDRSEYEKLQGKKFQVLVIFDTPQHIPFISLNPGEDLENATIYVRHGTNCVKADNHDLEVLLKCRMEANMISSIDFEKHILQLKILYENSSDGVKRGILSAIKPFFTANAEKHFNDYIDNLILKKQQLIEREIGIK